VTDILRAPTLAFRLKRGAWRVKASRIPIADALPGSPNVSESATGATPGEVALSPGPWRPQARCPGVIRQSGKSEMLETRFIGK